MQQHLAHALGHLDTAARALRAAVEAVPEPLRAHKPRPERWSTNEVVEHLDKVEQIFFRALLAALDTAKASGLSPEIDTPPALPDETRLLITDRTTPRSAPDPALPTGAIDAATSLRAIDARHAHVREALLACDGLALSTVTHEHRFFGRLNVYQWLELMAGHEGRHTAQVREIAAQVSPA